MFEEVLKTITSTSLEKIIVVSKDEDALKISKPYNTIQIFDDNESGVNNAVSLADNYLGDKDFDASIVFPQDIPIMQPEDVDDLLKFYKNTKSVLVVPSRRFDGTNALLRMPFDIMNTHYDEDSYKIHLATGKSQTINTHLVLIRRIMIDVDNQEDLEFILTQNEKPSFCEKISNLKL